MIVLLVIFFSDFMIFGRLLAMANNARNTHGSFLFWWNKFSICERNQNKAAPQEPGCWRLSLAGHWIMAIHKEYDSVYSNQTEVGHPCTYAYRAAIDMDQKLVTISEL